MPASPKNVVLIVNPAAGTSRSFNPLKLTKLPGIESSVAFEIVFSKSSGDIVNLARKHAQSGKIIFIAGGDGSVQEAAAGIKDTDSSLGILPLGSGNGLARHLQIDQRPSLAVRQLLFNSRILKADMVNLNDHLFINVAGIGFDGLISREFSLDGKRGLKTYLKHIIHQFFSYPEFEYKIEIEGQFHSGKAWMISFANGSEFGNGARIAPNASIQDGLVDIVAIRKPGFFQLPGMVWKLRSGKFDKKMIRRFRVKRFSLVLNHPLDLHLDGEYRGKTSEVKCSVIPGCLNLLAPETKSQP